MNLPPYPGPTIVTLVNGELVFDDAEEWRHETECRAILAMPLDRRRDWLFDLERMRGHEAVERISETMAALQEAKAT